MQFGRVGGFRDVEFGSLAHLAPVVQCDHQAEHQAARQHRQQAGQRAKGDCGADHHQANQHYHAGDHDYRRGQIRHDRIVLAVFRINQRGRGAGNEAAEKTQ